MSRPAFVPILLACVLSLGATAWAGSLSFNDKRMLKAFKKDWTRYQPDFERPTSAQRAEVERLFAKLATYLQRMSADGKASPEIVERQKELDALRLRLDAHFAGGGASEAPKAAAPRNLRTPPTVRPRQATGRVVTPAAAPSTAAPTAAEIARAFQKDYAEVSNRMRRARGSDLKDETFVASMAEGLKGLEARVAEAEALQPAMARQMSANLSALQKAWQQNVERAAGQTAKAGGSSGPARRVTVVRPRATSPSGGEGTEARLGAAASRRLQLFDKETGRGKRYFDAPKDEDFDSMQAHVAKLHKLLEAIPERDRAHPECLRRLERIKGYEDILAKRFPQGRPEKVVVVKPIPEADLMFVDGFDRDWKRFQPVFDDLEPDKQLHARNALSTLRDTFSRMGFHTRKHPEVQERRARLDAMEAKVDGVYGKVLPLSREDAGRLSEFRAQWNGVSYELGRDVQPMNLQDGAVKARVEKNFAKLRRLLGSIENRNDPNVMLQRQMVAEWEARYASALAKSSSMEALAGDVDGQLEDIQRQFPMKAFDPKLPEPHEPGAVEAWGRKLKGWLEGVKGARAFFDQAEKFSIKARSAEFRTYRYWFEQNVRGSILDAVKWSERDWRDPIHSAVHISMTEAELKNPERVKWSLEKVQGAIRSAELLLAFQRGYHGKEEAELLKDLETLEGNVGKLVGGEAEMVKKARLPEVGANDPKLEALAEEALQLAVQRGDITAWRGLRITGTIRHHRELCWWDGRFIPYIWDEFHGACAEKRDEGWRILYLTFKNYSEGYKDVTVGRWYVANWCRSGLILEENIDR